MKHTQLDLFDSRKGLDRGKLKIIEMIWYFSKRAFFLTSFPWPNTIQLTVLKVFGAKVGRKINIKPRVNIHLPWKLEIGDHTWIGEEVFILNFEPVTIGSNVCISQRAFLCTGNHDYRADDFAFRNAPLSIADGGWIGAQCFVGPGVNIGREAVATAGSVINQSLPENKICTGNPCIPIKDRW